MATTIGDLLVKLALDLSEFSRGLEQSISSLQSEVKAFNKLGSQMSSAIVDPLENIGKAAKESMGIVLDQFGKVASAASKVEKPVDAVTKSMNELRKEAREAWEATEHFGKTAEAAAKKAESAWGKTAANFEKLGGSMESLGTRLSVGITAPLVAIATYSLSAFAEFEKAMNRVSALGEVTGKELEKLSNQAMELGSKTVYSAKQAAEGMGELAAAGFKAREIFQAMPGVLALAATEGMKLADAARISAGILRGFGLDASAAGDVANVLAKTSAASAVSVTDLGYSFQYIAPLAKTLKISLLDISAALGVLGNNAIRGEAAGTALRSMFQDLIKPANKQAGQMLHQLGLDSKSLASGQMDLADILQKIQPLLKDAGVAFQVFGVRASDVLALAGSGTKAFKAMRDEIAKFNADGGAAAQMAKTMNQGLSGTFEQFTSQMEQVGIRIGAALAPAAERILKIGMNLLEWVEKLAVQFAKLPEPVQNVAIGLVALAAAAGPVILGLGAIVSSIGSVMTAMTGIGSIVGGWFAAEGALAGLVTGFEALAVACGGAAAATGVIGVALAALAGVAALAVDRIVKDSDRIGEVFAAVAKDSGRAMDYMGKHSKELSIIISAVLGPGLVTSVLAAWNAMGGSFAKILQNIGKVFDLWMLEKVASLQQTAYLIGAKDSATALWNWMEQIKGRIAGTAKATAESLSVVGVAASGTFTDLKNAQMSVESLLKRQEEFTGNLNRQVIGGAKGMAANKSMNVNEIQSQLMQITAATQALELSRTRGTIHTADAINMENKLADAYRSLQSQLVSIAPEFGRSGEAAVQAFERTAKSAKGAKGEINMANAAVLSLHDTIRKGSDSFEEFSKKYGASTKAAVAQTEAWKNSIAHVEEQYRLSGKKIPDAVKATIKETEAAISQNIQWTRMLDIENLHKEMEKAGEKAADALLKGWKKEADKQLKEKTINIDALLEPIVGTKNYGNESRTDSVSM